MKQNNGLTLIALVITIIVLLILAGVSLALTIGNNGILSRATTVESTYNQSEVLEELKTLCKCKEIARFAARKINNEYVSFGNEIEIDGKNKNIDYEPLCGKCYLQKVKKIKF